MASNPLVTQGTLNRLRGSIVVNNVPTLNITAPYLGKTGLSLALQGAATTFVETMVGAVPSPEPYQMCNITINVLKTNGIAAVWKSQMEATTLIGDIVVTTDSSAFATYTITNCAIESVADMALNGTNAEMQITVKGVYLLNNNLWNLA